MLSVLLAVLAAVSSDTASVPQCKAAPSESRGERDGVGLLRRLARQPVWFGGVAAILAGSALQVGALTAAPIVTVQPILILDLAFTMLLAAMVFHSRCGAGSGSRSRGCPPGWW